MLCPLCNKDSTRIFQKHGYGILECEACRHRFAEIEHSSDHIVNIYSDSYFFGGKDGYPDYLNKEKQLVRQGSKYAKICRKYMRPSAVLDVGCASGFILKGFKNSGWEAYGLEPNPKMAKYAEDQLGLNVEVGSLEDSSLKRTFKVISMIQVIAHFSDLRKALQTAARLTEPDGYWLIHVLL